MGACTACNVALAVLAAGIGIVLCTERDHTTESLNLFNDFFCFLPRVFCVFIIIILSTTIFRCRITVTSHNPFLKRGEKQK